jgi:hypothetical protein
MARISIRIGVRVKISFRNRHRAQVGLVLGLLLWLGFELI